MWKWPCILPFVLLLFPGPGGIILHGQDAITILPGGNVGIGTSTPDVKLEVSGTIKTTADIQAEGTIKSNSRVEDQSGPVPPIGSILMWPREKPPKGWLECDGSPVSRTAYADLFRLIGTAYGGGDGITTFNLPDMGGMFAPRVRESSAQESSAPKSSAPKSSALTSLEKVHVIFIIKH